jgi:uncharacterized protein YlzI (FlbEa/FlbD family)
MIDVTLVGGIYDQPTSDTVQSINEDEIISTIDDTTGNLSTRIKMKNGRTYFVKETRQEINERIKQNRKK